MQSRVVPIEYQLDFRPSDEIYLPTRDNSLDDTLVAESVSFNQRRVVLDVTASSVQELSVAPATENLAARSKPEKYLP